MLKSYTKQLVAKIQKKYIVIFVLNRKRAFHCSIRLFVRQAKMQNIHILGTQAVLDIYMRAKRSPN